MAKKQAKQKSQPQPKEEQAGLTLKDLLSEAALGKLKQTERDLKAKQEQAAAEEAERRRREKEEREKNKSFAELLDEYDQKKGGKYM